MSRHRFGLPLRTSLRVGVLGLAAVLGGCQTTTGSNRPAPAPATTFIIDTRSPYALLGSLQAAAKVSLDDYYETLRLVTDCQSLPGVCRLCEARATSAKAMVALRNTMVAAFGEAGEAAGTQMLRAAFLDQFEAVKRAEVYVGPRGGAVLRIGSAVYRLRSSPEGWRVVQFPDPPFDPAASAEAIEILVARTEEVRLDLEQGRIGSLRALEARLGSLIGR